MSSVWAHLDKGTKGLAVTGLQIDRIELKTGSGAHALALTDLKLAGSYGSAVVAVRSDWLQFRKTLHFSAYYAAEFISSLESMDRELKGSAELRDEYELDCLRLTMGRTGQVIISGEFTEHAVVRQHLEFGFETDQTVLRPLLADLQPLRLEVQRRDPRDRDG